jgi:hypothetical protein
VKYKRSVLLFAIFCIALVLPGLSYAQYRLKVEDHCGPCSGSSSPTRISGPYATEHDCLSAIQKLPKLYCKGSLCYPIRPSCDRIGDSGTTQDPPPPKKLKRWAYPTLAALACGTFGWAATADTDNPKSGLKSAAIAAGACGGGVLLLMEISKKFSVRANLVPGQSSPLIRDQPRKTSDFSVSVTFKVP